jgi:triacylglycerol lipase
LLLASVVVANLAPTMPFLEPAAAVLPLHFYQGGKAMTEFASAPLAVLLLMTALQAGAACWLFNRRDIRVIGEGVLDWRKASIGVAGWLVVYAGLVGAAAALGRPHTLYDSPQEVFAAVKQSLAERQWERFVGCLTPESRDRWTGMLVALGEFLQPQEAGGGNHLPPSETQHSAGTSGALFRSLGRAAVGMQTAMRHVDREHVKSLRGEIERSLAAGAPLPDETLRKLAQAVNDRDAFLVEGFSAMSGLVDYRLDISLGKVELKGDTATGELQLPFGITRTVEFHRTGGGWRIDLPLLHGKRPEQPPAEADPRVQEFVEYSVHFDQPLAEHGGQQLYADVFVPRGAGPHPAVLVLFGGGFNTGDRKQLARYAELLARHGFVAVCADYRLAPRHPYPAQLDDGKAAIAWMRAHADSYKIDPLRIGAAGYSAGGTLALLLGVTGKQEDVVDGQTADTRLQAVVAGGAGVDMRRLPEESDDLVSWLGTTRQRNPAAYEQASPIVHASPQSPPTAFFHGARDVTVALDGPMSPRPMFLKLKQLGVAAEMTVVPDADHLAALHAPAGVRAMWEFLERQLKDTRD